MEAQAKSWIVPTTHLSVFVVVFLNGFVRRVLCLTNHSFRLWFVADIRLTFWISERRLNIVIKIPTGAHQAVSFCTTPKNKILRHINHKTYFLTFTNFLKSITSNLQKKNCQQKGSYCYSKQVWWVWSRMHTRVAPLTPLVHGVLLECI